MDTTEITLLDVLTAKVTAFRTWAELEAACRGGYVPSLSQRTGGSAKEQPFRAILADALQQSGFRTF